jgi:hypothetical protein
MLEYRRAIVCNVYPDGFMWGNVDKSELASSDHVDEVNVLINVMWTLFQPILCVLDIWWLLCSCSLSPLNLVWFLLVLYCAISYRTHDSYSLWTGSGIHNRNPTPSCACMLTVSPSVYSYQASDVLEPAGRNIVEEVRSK